MRYRIQYDVGQSRYGLFFHDGEKTHKDGSPFYDVWLSSNLREFSRKIRQLEKAGYVRE